MKMFSDCAGQCGECTTSFSGGCLAGHGDNDFTPITRKWAIDHIIRMARTAWPVKAEQLQRFEDRFPGICETVEQKLTRKDKA